VSADPPDLPGPPDPSLDRLYRVLTADGSANELADRPAALAMFRDRRRQPRRWFSLPRGTAAAALVIAAGTAAAYAAVLPAPVQHIAYRLLDGIGVPDAKHPSASASARPGTVTLPSTTSNSAVAAATVPACPCPTGKPEPNPVQNPVPARDLVLALAYARIPADGNEILSGRLAPGGRAEPGVRVRLWERVRNGRSGWGVAGTAVTDRRGEVTFTVQHLTSNATFRLSGPKGAASLPVTVTVIPPVSLRLTAGKQAGTDLLTAVAPFADAGDAVVLQELSGGGWRRIGEHTLDQGHQAFFAIRIPASGSLVYRVVLPRTSSHGWSASGRVRAAARGRPTPRPTPTRPRVTRPSPPASP
jgi:hypothetical protein